MEKTEELKRIDHNGLQKKHFAKIHERIHNKYEEMQRKIARSKSLNSISQLSNDDVSDNQAPKYGSNYNLKELDDNLDPIYVNNDDLRKLDNNPDPKYVSNYDLQELDEFEPTHKEPMEDTPGVIINDEVPMDFYKQSVVFEPKNKATVIPIIVENKEVDFVNQDHFLTLRDHSPSLSSLTDISKTGSENEIYICKPSLSSSPRSIREKLSSHFSRRRRVKENKSKIKDESKVKREIKEKAQKQNIQKVLKINRLGTITIALIEVSGFDNISTEEKFRLLNCRLKLGTEKFKSKTIKSKKNRVQFQELCNFGLFEDNIVSITLWDKDTFLGLCSVNLLELEKEKTHRLRLNLEGAMSHIVIFILLTISGTNEDNSLIDKDDYDKMQTRIEKIKKDYVWYKVKNDDTAVGYLSVIVYGAKGLSSNETYCVLELGNDRLQTHTEYKTNNPNWMKSFIFILSGVTTLLEVSVYDEKKFEVVGKIVLMLLSIKNGETKWYALKDANLRERAKGTNPRILLEIKLTWHMIKASIKVLNPKEAKYLEGDKKFDRHVLAKNWMRIKAVYNWIVEVLTLTKTCFEWESRSWNVIALTVWLIFLWNFKTWMLPLLLLVPFVWYRPPQYFLFNWKKHVRKEKVSIDDDEEKVDKSTSLRHKIQSLQDMVYNVQNALGKAASYGESVKNLYNFSVPYLSLLAIFIILFLSFIIYLIPVNYIFMLWGVHKFTRKILRPNRIPNSEILDLLSRVPDDNTLNDCELLPLESDSEEEELFSKQIF